MVMPVGMLVDIKKETKQCQTEGKALLPSSSELIWSIKHAGHVSCETEPNQVVVLGNYGHF